MILHGRIITRVSFPSIFYESSSRLPKKTPSNSQDFLQVLLRWGLEKGCAIIPKSVRKERIQEFAESELLSWRLTEEHMDALDALPKTEKYCWDPQGVA